MFFKNYLPRSENSEIKYNLKYLKFALIFLFFCTILITFVFSTEDKNKMVLSKDSSKNNFNQNTLTLKNAKLIGNDRNNKPYVITAKSSFKNNLDENLIHYSFAFLVRRQRDGLGSRSVWAFAFSRKRCNLPAQPVEPVLAVRVRRPKG